MSKRPAPPPGFRLDDDEDENTPAPPAGFQIDTPPPRQARAPAAPMPQDATGATAIDGDTLRLTTGQHVRLPVVDAPELKQSGWDRQGRPVPIGRQSLDATAAAINGAQARLGTPIGQSYGRTVAPVDVGGRDLGLDLTAEGRVLTDARYLPRNPQQRYDYVQSERLARQNRLGMHNTFHQTPAEFRADPNYQPSREEVAQFWDTPTPLAGMKSEAEQRYLAMLNDHTVKPADVVAFAKSQGFNVAPEGIEKAREQSRLSHQPIQIDYRSPVRPLTDPGDGKTGAGVRGTVNGLLFEQLEELGAGVDTFGLTPGRENIWNSDRRLADIYVNNLSQNEAITGFDGSEHPYIYGGGQVAGSFLFPMARVRSAADLAKWGAAYGGLTGLGQEGTLPERLSSGVVGAGMGAATTILGTRALEAAAPWVSKGVSRVLGREAPLPETGLPSWDAAPPPPDGFTVDPAPERTRDIIDIGGGATSELPLRAPIDTSYPGPAGGRERDWIDIGQVPQPPSGFTLDMPGGRPWVDVGLPANDARSIAMDGPAVPSISQELPQRVPDYLFPPQPQRMGDPLSDARSAAIANDIAPRDVVPIRSNEVGSAEEAAVISAGRYEPARPINEATALEPRTITAQNGRQVSKRGPLDMLTWLRTQGGVRDQGGDLRAMGIDNKPRDMDFARGEQRFGKLIDNDNGMSLDDAAFAAWEAGYLPGHDRPDINAFLDAIDRTHSGAERFYHPDDLPEVTRYEGMQADRKALEEQLSYGPVYNDRAVPAGPDQPFAPPEAYEEWPAGGPDFAGNIRLDKLDTPQDIKRALSTVNNRFGFDAATRGRVAHAETERLAGELGMSPEQLLSRRRGQALNAEEALAARQILAKSGNELVNLAKRVQGMETPGDDVLAQFSQALRRHAAIQEQVSGMTAEAGRTLSQFRMLADSRKVPGEVLGRLVDMNGGRGRLQDAAQTILDTIETEPGKFNPLVEKLSKPRWIDKAIELRYNMMLSGPQTHAANVISNSLTAITQIPEHGVASLIGLARRGAVGASRSADRVYPSELASRAFGLLQGTKAGLGQFVRTLKTGNTSDLVSKVESQSQEAISGLKGKVLRLPTRALSAEDELFKAMARNMELYGLADRAASAQLLSGEAKAKRIADLVANPTDDMLEKAFDYARYVTFQRPLNGIPQSISAFTNKHPVAKLVIPFVRTPTNLLKFAAERSPAAPLIKEWRADFMAGGARRDLAIAKAAVGSGIAFWIADLAQQGLVTGSSPTDKNKANLMRADGWQPYSVRVGDQWLSYSRMDPFALTMGTAADLATKRDGMTPRQVEDASGLLVASIIRNMGDKTWLSGLSDMFGMLSDPQRNLGNYTASQAASLTVPALASQLRGAIDPVRRETNSTAEEIQSRIPWASQSLPPARDIWGEAKTTDRVGPDIASPVTRTRVENDPVNREMLRLGAPATEFPRRHKVAGKWVEYTPQEYDRLQRAAGLSAHAALTGLVTSDQWKGLTPDAQRKAIDNTIRASRADAKAKVLGDAPAGAFKAASQALRGAPRLDPPPPAGFQADGEAGGVNVFAELQRSIPGVRFTSGFRTPAYQAEMRKRGYNPAFNSGHLDGSSLDMLPPPGKTLGWLKGQVARRYPHAPLLVHDGHLHATFPGYYGAPVLGGAKSAGIRNPNIGMPAPPPGFKLD